MCKTITVHQEKRTRCTGRLVSGTFLLSGRGIVQATLSQGRTKYAAGERLDLGGRRSELVPRALRPMRPGGHTLTFWRRRGHRGITSRRRIAMT